MNVDSIPAQQRAFFLWVFHLFRSHNNESGEGFDNRALLEAKLQYGGILTDVDQYMICTAVANESPSDYGWVYSFFGNW